MECLNIRSDLCPGYQALKSFNKAGKNNITDIQIAMLQ